MLKNNHLDIYPSLFTLICRARPSDIQAILDNRGKLEARAEQVAWKTMRVYALDGDAVWFDRGVEEHRMEYRPGRAKRISPVAFQQLTGVMPLDEQTVSEHVEQFFDQAAGEDYTAVSVVTNNGQAMTYAIYDRKLVAGVDRRWVIQESRTTPESFAKSNPAVYAMTEAEKQARLDVCAECLHYSPQRNTCTLCSCKLPYKVSVRTGRCPHPDGDKWAGLVAEE